MHYRNTTLIRSLETEVHKRQSPAEWFCKLVYAAYRDNRRIRSRRRFHLNCMQTTPKIMALLVRSDPRIDGGDINCTQLTQHEQLANKTIDSGTSNFFWL